jgi:hypothetical protein
LLLSLIAPRLSELVFARRANRIAQAEKVQAPPVAEFFPNAQASSIDGVLEL